MKYHVMLAILLSAAAAPPLAAQEMWKPAPGPLQTRWTADVTPEQVHPEYPRPQLVRDAWTNLNGLWEYAITPREQERPAAFDGKILVPFAVESSLSGVGRTVGADHALWYRRSFEAPPDVLEGKRILLLHFGAVDWHATVWVNGQQVATHRGGYDPFTIDVTGALSAENPQQLLVRVWDPTDQGFQPRGKQVAEPRGIWYTSVTGIWRTVWMESVPATSIEALRITPDVDASAVRVAWKRRGPSEPVQCVVQVLDGDIVVGEGTTESSEPLEIKLPHPKLWSPDSPFLYGLKVRLQAADGSLIDSVSSYFGMRKISLGSDEAGHVRLCLNNKPLFQFGPLDQGWWPDGLYTAPTDEALRYDLEMTKRLGFNMIRKHVKVEPDRWYHHCDRLGLLVWQDMPNGDRHIAPHEKDIVRSRESEANYFAEWGAIMDSLGNHPCIVVWVPFNEGWGQFRTNEVLAWTKERDPTRLVDGPSGWADRGGGDMHDMHRYPGPAMPEPEASRAVVLGEFGGLGLPLEGHLWWNKRNWGYRTYSTRDELQMNYETLIRRLLPLIPQGLAAAVYTQTTDVEGEVNGLMTYDRAVTKLDAERIAALHARLYAPQKPVKLATVAATSESQPQIWRYTTSPPADGWASAEFDDSSWKAGPGGFGEPSTPGSVVRTRWKTDDIWMRRTFQADEKHGVLYVRAHHDEDAEVYLNGVRIATLSGYVTEYFELELGDEARQALRPGRNVLAVHCHQTGGGQYIDIGLKIAESDAK